MVTKQHLVGETPARSSPDDFVKVARDLAFVQWDPISIVAPSHLISFWSRVGDFEPATLDRLLWEEKKLFLAWTPVASVVPPEDYPLHASCMRRYPDSLSDSWRAQREEARKFLAGHKPLRRAILKQLEDGPLLLPQVEDHVLTGRHDQ